MCFGCSKELSHRLGSFEYPQHMFWWRNKKNNFQLRTLIWGAVLDTKILTKQDYNISNNSLFLLANKMLVIRTGIHKMLVGIANREDPDQTASEEAV